tara:strand:- start:254 stop:1078 length:825 start_codon:yes stop_codon:yes gene_type:complete
MKIKHKKIDLSTKMVMGILNLSYNSFYDGGKYNSDKEIINQVEKMLLEGASIIDIGAQSSKPGSHEISESEELIKLTQCIKLIKTKFPNTILSIDTYRSHVAEQCINNGADIINDISAGELDKNMYQTIAKFQVPYIIMHMKGVPLTMQGHPTYTNVIKEIFTYFEKKIKKLKQIGINDIAIDPGFGFGKTTEDNYKILNNLKKLKELNKPILIGASRKSMIYNVIEKKSENSLNGTTIINTIALQNGANILRVHDVKEAIECIKITNFAQNNI